jgi:hypothetical protein
MTRYLEMRTESKMCDEDRQRIEEEAAIIGYAPAWDYLVP